MADVLTIDAVSWEVQSSGAAIDRVPIGSVSRAFDGSLRSSRRALFKESSGFRTAPLDATEAAAFEAYDDGALHTVAGEFFGSVSALIAIEGSDLIDYSGTDFRTVHRFKISTT